MLHVHRSERADGLIAMLGDVLADPLDDPMVAEVVAVPTHGLERWLVQQLSTRLGVTPGRADGVCANIDFPFPATLVGRALAAAGALPPDADPWSPGRLVWPLLEVVDAGLEEPELAPLAAHLRSSAPEGETRRFAIVRHIADLYDRYSVHRPEMLAAWAAPERGASGERGAGDEGGRGEAPDWQQALWLRLRRRIGVPSPAERLGDACRLLRAQPGLVDLPFRVSLFGLTRLPASYLDVLEAVAARRDVHLFLLHPSPALWDRIAGHSLARTVRRSEDPTVADAVHPLLASWGRDARETQLALTAGRHPVDHHLAVADDDSDLLHRLQSDVRANRPPVRRSLDPSDGSVTVHACHGRARQVEVLREAILHLLNDDPTLEPRDVIVMCPDVETFAPLILATFGTYDPDDEDPAAGPNLRVRLADRSLRQTNPVLGVVAELLDLVTARITATQVLDLAAREPVRRRFHLDDDDLARAQEWVAEAGVRWGIDADHRAPFKLERLEANTWRAGLDRVLLGVTMADEGQRRFGGVLPLDDVDSGDIELAGRLAELVDRLSSAVDALAGVRPIDGWAATLADAADAFTATTDRDAWQRRELQRLTDELVEEATTGGAVSPVELGPGDVRALLADRLRGRPTKANFRTGHLTICTLVPMRSVPHRVICLLGLDDGAFPRHVERDGDDRLAADPHVGDRDARGEDRQLLLDALLAATDRLVITYSGRDERSNVEKPPAVPLGELLDAIDRTADTPSGPARRRIVVHHPLQPFDPRNFTPGALTAGRTWSFDPVHLGGAQALLRPRVEPGPFLPGPLPALDTKTIELTQLERFVRHPTREFLRARLGLSLADWSEEPDDSLPIELDGLEQWRIAERILAARLGGASPTECAEAERARGLLPPGALAQSILDGIMPIVEEVVAADDGRSAGAEGTPPASLDIQLVLDGGVTLIGTVAGVRGDVLHAVQYSRVAPSHRLAAWVRLLALSASRPERAFESLLIGRARPGVRRVRVTTAAIRPLGPDPASREAVARRELDVLVDLFRRGMTEPLPIYGRTSAAWAEAGDPAAAAKAAEREWTSTFSWDREDKEPEHVLVLGGQLTFDALQAHRGPPRPDEGGDGWDSGEGTRLGRYAHRLWDGLLSREELTDR